jgi:hypothetical protein
MVTPAEPVLKTKMEDMGSLRGPRKRSPDVAPSGNLGVMEIIQRSAKQEMGGKGDVNQVLNGLAALIKKKVVQLIHIGNTVFMIMPKSGGAVEFHVFTVESPQELTQRFQAGAKVLKQMGFKQAFSYSESPAFVKMAQQSGLPVKINQGQQTIRGQQKPTYQFVLDL